MHDANPAELNFTWQLPDGSEQLGHSLNSTASYITVHPSQSNDFGRVTCRAQNALDLVGECHLNIIMGGK